MQSIGFMNEERPPSKEEMQKMRLAQQKDYVEDIMLDVSAKQAAQDQYQMHNPNYREAPSSYYERTHIEVYDDEVGAIRAALEGKIPMLQDGMKAYDYPQEIFFEVMVYPPNETPYKVYLIEQDIDPRYMQETGKTKTRPVKKPFCTPEGQREILSFCSSKLTGGTALSNYQSVEHVMSRTLDDGLTLCELMYLNARKWKIDPTRFDSVLSTLTDRIETVRLRALFGKTSELPTKNQNITTFENKGEMRTQIPFLGGLMGGQNKQGGQ